MKFKNLILSLTAVAMAAPFADAQRPVDFSVKNDSITYNLDSRGNRLLDFSYCGYAGSDRQIPDVKGAIYVGWEEGDNSERIQRAINYVATLPLGADGIRGAVILGKGTFEIDRPLYIVASGIVLRGSGPSETILLKKGVDRGAAVYIEGQRNIVGLDTATVTNDYVPVNSRELTLSSTAGIKVGTTVRITRPTSKEWIAEVGCNIFGGGIDALGWKPGDADLTWDRTVTAVSGNTITIDAPLSYPLEKKWGATTVVPYTWTGRISECGVENLSIESEYDKKYPKDEDHCWVGVSIDNARDCWVRNCAFRYLAGSAVIALPYASRVTVEDCIASDPVSEIGGMRRQVFSTLGQQTLFQRCYSKNGINDFSAGMYAAGPNAFVQCDAEEALGFSGSVDAFAPGLLFDVVNIDGNDIVFKNLGQDKNGAGWNTANSMAWQCTAAGIDVYQMADDAPNRAFGCWAQFSGDGQWGQSNNHVSPRSLFYYQLAERLDSVPEAQSRIMPKNTSATSSPTVEAAMKLAEEAYAPVLTMKKWIGEVPFTASVSPDGLKNVDEIKVTRRVPARVPDYEIKNGRLVKDGMLMAGNRHEVPWWNGKLKPNYTETKAKPHVTRFVPGREGLGLTDRVDSVVASMKRDNILVLDHNYGLWYDRRRDDHERVRRRDGDVWAPFYDQPFARSGEGTAWEGLSRYDLTRPNRWYWNRLNEFASKGATQGLLLFNEHYFQHNILEAGAHWVDSPWRSTNNINETGFPEPAPFAGDKRIFVADMFYDTIQPVRKDLHRQFIRQNLDALADNPNVVHLISNEYTGPLHFTEFWLDVVGEWEAETGRHPLIALAATKDVQDSILADPRRAALVDIIDIRYWNYNTDSIFNPRGGKNLAPRQHKRKMKVGKVGFDQVYRAVSEYRKAYPDKAVTYYGEKYPENGWAVFMAGGSNPVIPVYDEDFLRDAATMEIVETPDSYRQLGREDSAVIYPLEATDALLDLKKGTYTVFAFNPTTGARTVAVKRLKVNGPTTLPVAPGSVYWITRK